MNKTKHTSYHEHFDITKKKTGKCYLQREVKTMLLVLSKYNKKVCSISVDML